MNDNLNAFIEDKRVKKKRLLNYIAESEGVDIPQEFLLFMQAGEPRESDRRIMAAFAMLELYYGIRCGRLRGLPPCAFIFGAEGSPRDGASAAAMKFIGEAVKLINGSARTDKRIKAVLLRDYGGDCTDIIAAGADVGLQFSDAVGKENVSLFKESGALICGTPQSVNAADGGYIFGATAEEIEKLKAEGYKPTKYISNPNHKKAVNSLVDGTFSDGGTGEFSALYDSLINAEQPDSYFVLYDLDSCVDSFTKICRDYADKNAFAEKQFASYKRALRFLSPVKNI